MFILEDNSKQINYFFENGKSQTFEINLTAVINKYDDIFNIVNDMLTYNHQFKLEYEKFLLDYVNVPPTKRLVTFLFYFYKLSKQIDSIFDEMELGKNLVVKVDSKFCMNINYEESMQLFRTSVRTRFFIPCYLSNYEVDSYEQKTLQSHICKEIIEQGIVDKLYRIIDSIIMCTYPNRSGKKLWDMLSSTGGYNSDSYALKLLSSMFYKALPSLKADENPVAYMISICKNEIDWLLRTNLGINCFNSTIDAASLSVMENSRIFETEIYYRSIVKNCFTAVDNEYMEYDSVKNYNVYPIIFNISQLVLNKIFGVPMRYVNVDKMCVMNFYVHKFLTKYDSNKTELLKMLLSVPTLVKTPDGNFRELPSIYKTQIQVELAERNIQKYFSFLSHITIKKIITEAISNLYRYRYIDVKNAEEVKIDWALFISQYIDYIYNLSSEEYVKPIQTEIDHINFEPDNVR